MIVFAGQNIIQRSLYDGPGFEGDIILTEEQKDLITAEVRPNLIFQDPRKKWLKHGSHVIVPYEIGTGYSRSEIDVIDNALRRFEQQTCVKYV